MYGYLTILCCLFLARWRSHVDEGCGEVTADTLAYLDLVSAGFSTRLVERARSHIYQVMDTEARLVEAHESRRTNRELAITFYQTKLRHLLSH